MFGASSALKLRVTGTWLVLQELICPMTRYLNKPRPEGSREVRGTDRVPFSQWTRSGSYSWKEFVKTSAYSRDERIAHGGQVV